MIAKNLTKNFGGISSNLSYKNIELAIHLQYAKQTGRGINTTERAFGNQPFNISRTSFEDRWQNVGDQAAHPRAAKKWATGTWASNFATLYRSSSALYQDASYLRLKNVNLSYRLPRKLMESLRLQQCRVYFQGQNLLTFSPMKDIDPETQATLLSIPLAPLRMLTFGVQVTL